MSKRGKSLRERQIDVILDHMERPPYLLHAAGGNTFIVEKRPSPRIDLSEPLSMVDVLNLSIDRFRDEKLAKFVRNSKNAEALLDALRAEERGR